MKKIISLLFVISILVSTCLLASAVKPTFDAAQWEDVFTGATINNSAEGVLMSGKGYESAKAAKFMFRHTVAYNVTDSTVTVKFPNTFEGCDFNLLPDYTYLIGFGGSSGGWTNSVPGIVFVIRPQSDTKVNVELAGNNGVIEWTGSSDVKEPMEVTLGADRTLTVALKKTGNTTMTIVNGKNYGPLEASFQAAVDKFKNNKCYLKFGGTSERDTEMKNTMQMTITDLTGKTVVESAISSSSSAATSVASSASSSSAANSTASSVAVSNESSTDTTVTPITPIGNTNGKINPAIIILAIVILLSAAGMVTAYIFFKNKEVATLKAALLKANINVDEIIKE